MALVGYRRRFISGVYATHNRAFRIKKALAICMERLKDGELGLNVGSDTTRLHPAIVNLDLIKIRQSIFVLKQSSYRLATRCFK